MKGLRIQKRDLRLITAVFLHRIASRDHFLGLGYFGSLPRCNERLSQLVTAGWLRRITKVNGVLVQQGLYAVGSAATPYLVQSTDLPAEEVMQQCAVREGPLLVEHSLKALDFRLAMKQASSRENIQIIDWLCEIECLHEFQYRLKPSAAWSKTVMKPDGYVRLQHSGKVYDCFIEIDLGHVALPRFTEKLGRYEQYLKSGAFQTTYDSSAFNLLTITVGERRLSHLASIAYAPGRHFLTTWHRIDAMGVLGPAWTCKKQSDIFLLDALIETRRTQ